MKRHTLPGEGGECDWFRRLNPFEQQETKRQVQFKRCLWPNLPDGVWSKRPGYTYPHILPEGELERSFYPPIAAEVLEYCRSSDIAIHSEALNLRSSQVCCFNVMFPLRQDLELAKLALTDVLPDVTKVAAIEFEYTGPEEATVWLGEPAGGQRGQNRTSIDAAVWWTSQAGNFLTLCEWKYTEKAYGTCGGYASRGNRDKGRCRQLDVAKDDPASRCYLTHGRHNRRYWDRLSEAGISLTALARLKGCPFMGPFYQLMRQYLLAGYLRHHDGDLDEVFVASLGFRGNASLRSVPVAQRSLGETVEDAWNACLDHVPQLQHVDVESIVARLRTTPSDVEQEWLDYLSARYGL